MAKKGERETATTEGKATDKALFAAALREAGFRVELTTDSVPTVLSADSAQMKKDIEAVRKLAEERGYNGSFGIRGPRGVQNTGSTEVQEREEASDEVPQIENFTQLTLEGLSITAA